MKHSEFITLLLRWTFFVAGDVVNGWIYATFRKFSRIPRDIISTVATRVWSSFEFQRFPYCISTAASNLVNSIG
jgi:hypothetical protein